MFNQVYLQQTFLQNIFYNRFLRDFLNYSSEKTEDAFLITP